MYPIQFCKNGKEIHSRMPLRNFTKSILNMKNEDKRRRGVFIVGQHLEVQ